MMNKRPIDYGELACRALMHKYTPEKLPPEGVFFYHQGVFLSGMQQIYKLNGNREYFDYIKAYVDSVIGENGELIGFVHELTEKETPRLAKEALTMLDHKQPTILLYDLWNETGDEKYKNAIVEAAKSMYYWPVNTEGGYWHMMTQHNQMWLDGAYMAGILSVMYAKYFDEPVLRDRAIKQILIMNKHMRDEKTGLYYHGWDESKEAPWADKETGLSENFWGRAMGWYAVAIVDMLEYIPENHPDAEKLIEIERQLLKDLAKFQDRKTGMWFQVLDKVDAEDNWVESSCTALFLYTYSKAVRMGIIDNEEYAEVIKKAYNGLIETLYYDEEGYLVIDNVCSGLCIVRGDYRWYADYKKVKNDLHGAGAFILMCAELQKYEDFTGTALISQSLYKV